MVTLHRPHRHSHGPAAVTVHLSRSSRHQQPSPLLRRSCRSSALRPMAQDPSHPHRQTKDTAAPPSPPQQQPEIAHHQPAPEQPPPPREEASSSSNSTGSDTGSSWLHLGLGPSPSSPSPSSSRSRKRHRTNDVAGPSTSVQSAAPPPQLQLSLHHGPSSSAPAVAVGAVVAATAPPPLHESGTWFLLQAAQNQGREPPLPQIPRIYLRVRDGRMTVRVVMRYLVNKLGLEDDSQLEITCRGQRLPPTMTLQQVHNTIWRPVPAEAVVVIPLPGSPSTNQIMTLHYGRS